MWHINNKTLVSQQARGRRVCLQSGLGVFPGDAVDPVGSLFHHQQHAGPFAPGQPGFIPTGNLLTSDNGGPYNLTALSVQENEIKGALPVCKWLVQGRAFAWQVAWQVPAKRLCTAFVVSQGLSCRPWLCASAKHAQVAVS